jgi:hypothetical protein
MHVGGDQETPENLLGPLRTSRFETEPCPSRAGWALQPAAARDERVIAAFLYSTESETRLTKGSEGLDSFRKKSADPRSRGIIR